MWWLMVHQSSMSLQVSYRSLNAWGLLRSMRFRQLSADVFFSLPCIRSTLITRLTTQAGGVGQKLDFERAVHFEAHKKSVETAAD